MESVVIIGGGIAGLSCLNALLDQGVSPLLLEAATIGTPKMCGEFIAPQTVDLLQNWGIDSIQPIQKIIFSAKNKKFNLTLQKSAGAIARNAVEHLLAERAREKGGRIRENSSIQKIIPATISNPIYTFYLPTGEEIHAKTAIFATGRIGQTTSIPPIYVGIKTHIKHILEPATLMMYSVKDAYFGIVPISQDTSNCACLVKREAVENSGSCHEFLYHLIKEHAHLSDLKFNELTWLEARTPEFGKKIIPEWPNAYWIGDAIASLHPAIGSGFAHGMTSAMMAVDYYLQNNPSEYRKICLQGIHSKLQIGKWLHQLLLQPTLSFCMLPLLQFNPWISVLLQKKLGYN